MGWLPQRAGSPNLNGGGTAAAVPGTPSSNDNGVVEISDFQLYTSALFEIFNIV